MLTIITPKENYKYITSKNKLILLNFIYNILFIIPVILITILIFLNGDFSKKKIYYLASFII